MHASCASPTRVLLRSPSPPQWQLSDLVAALASNPYSCLRTLSLAGNNLRNDSADVLAAALASETCRLRELDISEASLTAQGATALSRAIRRNRCGGYRGDGDATDPAATPLPRHCHAAASR